MKLLVLTDIHGNSTALFAVLQKVRRQSIDRIIFCGDYITDFPGFSAVLKTVREKSDYAVKGNREINCLRYVKGEREQIDRYLQLRSLRWCYNSLTKEELDFIKALPEQAEGTLCGRKILIFHGSPSSNSEVLKIDRDKEKIESYLKNAKADLLIGGHSHRPFVHSLSGKMFVNAGSIGLGFTRPCTAEYAVVDITASNITAEIGYAEYSYAETERQVRKSALYPQAPVWSELLLWAVRTATNKPMEYIRYVQAQTGISSEKGKPLDDTLWEQWYPRFCREHAKE